MMLPSGTDNGITTWAIPGYPTINLSPTSEYMTIDAGTSKKIVGIVMQGRPIYR